MQSRDDPLRRVRSLRRGGPDSLCFLRNKIRPAQWGVPCSEYRQFRGQYKKCLPVGCVSDFDRPALLWLGVPRRPAALSLRFGEEICFDGGDWSGIHLDSVYRPVQTDLLPLAAAPAIPAGNQLFGGDFLRGGFADRRSRHDFFRAFPPGIAGSAWPVRRFLHPHDMVGAAAKHKLLAV